MPPQRKDICDCDTLERMADNPKCPVEFDAELNEFHIVGQGHSQWMIYYCPFCGGSAPKSRRSHLFHKITDDESRRLCDLTKQIRTLQDVTAAFGEPEIRQAVGLVQTTPERDGKPETTRSYPVMIYTKLSELVDMHVTIYPTERVGISFRGKPIKKNAS